MGLLDYLHLFADNNLRAWSDEFVFLKEYLIYLDENIDEIMSRIERSIYEKAEYGGDGDYYFKPICPETARLIFERYQYNNYFLSLWAAYETGINEIALYLAKANKTEEFRKNKDALIIELLEYLQKFHSVDINSSKDFSKDNIRNIYNLRNKIAHFGGRFECIEENDKQKITTKDLLRWINTLPNVTFEKDILLLSSDFCHNALDLLSNSFDNIFKQAYALAQIKEPREIGGYISW